MGLNQPHVATAFKTMLKKIEYLSEVLQADVLDDQKQLCSKAYFDDCRARVAALCDYSTVEPVM